MKYIIRVLEIAISAYASYMVFWAVNREYYRYLPDISRLNVINESQSLPVLLRENSNALRDLFNEAFEMSILYSAISFVVVMILLNYIRFGIFFKVYSSSYYKDIKEIREMNSK